MKRQKNDPFEGLVLDKYEQEIENAIELKDVFTLSKSDQIKFAEIAKQHNLFKVSNRINTQDLARVKSKAKDNDIPYQTLIGSLVHKYASGDIKVNL
jgi:predicted DNA binding CopG/RHH family protein